MSFTPEHFAVWTEIPVTDLERAIRYYETVTTAKLTLEPHSPVPMANFPTAGGKGVAGHLFVGTPAPKGSGAVVHLAAHGPLEKVMDRVTAAGGEVVSDIFTIPAGRFVYTLDPDGNRVGFFERAA